MNTINHLWSAITCAHLEKFMEGRGRRSPRLTPCRACNQSFFGVLGTHLTTHFHNPWSDELNQGGEEIDETAVLDTMIEPERWNLTVNLNPRISETANICTPMWTMVP
jgi:hypothetical protein